MSTNDLPQLRLQFAGRVIEHLGIQMYQSPVNAIAELVANSWDADAHSVSILLPSEKGDAFVIRDDGVGMTHEECQEFYLNVGRNRRAGNPREVTSKLHRSVLGRKGIGKFAGFGIARTITVTTTSERTGERTTFQLKLDDLLKDDYVSSSGEPVPVLEYTAPDEAHRIEHGTEITLTDLTVGKRPSPNQFRTSMARRFLLHQQQEDFEVTVDGLDLPEAFDEAGVEFVFPRDLDPELLPGVVVDDEGWGLEEVSGNKIRWRLLFFRDTIDEEELKGVAIYAKGKIAQRPFLFHLTRGLTGQHGAEYLAGQVEADYIDDLPADLIATERQRINWNDEATQPLLEWGQRRLRHSLKIWSELRATDRRRRIEDRLAGFSQRLEALERHERRTVTGALQYLAQVDTLTEEQLDQLGGAILTAWEKGRLRELIDEISQSAEATPEKLLEILIEAKVLTALQTSEVVQTKLQTVVGLRKRIEMRELENAVRDFIADNPWLISPEWETFTRERSLSTVMARAATTAGLAGDIYRGRVDLTMSSGRHLLVLEFMRPGLQINSDHVNRFETYVDQIRIAVKAETGGRFTEVTGYLIGDKVEESALLHPKLERIARASMYVRSWETIFAEAERAWRDFVDILEERGGDDPRVQRALQLGRAKLGDEE